MKINQIRLLISSAILVFVLSLIVGLFFLNIPTDNKDLVNILLGATLGWVGSIISFYFDKRNDGDNK